MSTGIGTNKYVLQFPFDNTTRCSWYNSDGEEIFSIGIFLDTLEVVIGSTRESFADAVDGGEYTGEIVIENNEGEIAINGVSITTFNSTQLPFATEFSLNSTGIFGPVNYEPIMMTETRSTDYIGDLEIATTNGSYINDFILKWYDPSGDQILYILWGWNGSQLRYDVNGTWHCMDGQVLASCPNIQQTDEATVHLNVTTSGVTFTLNDVKYPMINVGIPYNSTLAFGAYTGVINNSSFEAIGGGSGPSGCTDCNNCLDKACNEGYDCVEVDDGVFECQKLKKTPWYASWWFITIIVLLVLAIVGFLTYYFLKKGKAKEPATKELVTKESMTVKPTSSVSPLKPLPSTSPLKPPSTSMLPPIK